MTMMTMMMMIMAVGTTTLTAPARGMLSEAASVDDEDGCGDLARGGPGGVWLVCSSSVHVFEQTQLLLRNLDDFVGCDVVLHHSVPSAMLPEELERLISERRPLRAARGGGAVVVAANPVRLSMASAHRASPASLLDVWLCNYAYALERFPRLTHVMLVQENERFVRHGLAHYLAARSEVGAFFSGIPRHGCLGSSAPSAIEGECDPHGEGEAIRRDPLLAAALASCASGGSTGGFPVVPHTPALYYGQADGACVRRDVLERVLARGGTRVASLGQARRRARPELDRRAGGRAADARDRCAQGGRGGSGKSICAGAAREERDVVARVLEFRCLVAALSSL